jgi:hypothetical protein
LSQAFVAIVHEDWTKRLSCYHATLPHLKEENGLYNAAFGSEGELPKMWSEMEFKETLLAVHAFNRIEAELKKLQEKNDDLRQVGRLKYYGLSLFKFYIDEMLPQHAEIEGKRQAVTVQVL